MEWKAAVTRAIDRYCNEKRTEYFTRQELIQKELYQIILDTKCVGATPSQTLSRVLQELRDSGEIEFVKRGVYRKLRKDS